MQDYRMFRNQTDKQDLAAAIETDRVRFDHFDAKKMRYSYNFV